MDHTFSIGDRSRKRFILMGKEELLNIVCHLWSHIILLEYGSWTSEAMRNATVQQPILTVSPNLNPTIPMLPVEAGFVSKKSFKSIAHVHYSTHQLQCKHLWF
ncbi:hypothetical protein TNCV_248671 [Trichonephila clavipes]|nr:hypothetical protein TNCV_248671 [Trichonephila clavipes]